MSIAIPLLITGKTLLSAYGGYEQGQLAKRQMEASARDARSEAAIHAYNAELAVKEGMAEREATMYELIQHRRISKQIMAKSRASIGKSGVTPEGSPLLVMEDTAAQLALEHVLMTEAGVRRVGQWKSKSILDLKKAEAARQRSASYLRAGEDYARAGMVRAGTSLLGGAFETALWDKL